MQLAPLLQQEVPRHRGVMHFSQLQQWNKPALKPNSPTLIRDSCFTVHKDDKADTAAVVYKPTITYPHRPGDGMINEARFDKGFRECSFKMQYSSNNTLLTPHMFLVAFNIVDTPEIHPQMFCTLCLIIAHVFLRQKSHFKCYVQLCMHL